MIWVRKGASRGESVERASWLGRVWDDDGGMSVVTWSADAGNSGCCCGDHLLMLVAFVLILSSEVLFLGVFVIFSAKKAFRKAGAANSQAVDDEGRAEKPSF